MPTHAKDPTMDELHEDNAIKTIFWPRNISGVGYLYGWTIDQDTICVAGVLCLADIQTAQQDLKSANQKLEATLKLVGDLGILGVCVIEDAPLQPEELSHEHLIIGLDGRYPRLHSEPTIPARFILYDPPDSRKLRFLAQRPLALDTTFYRLLDPDDVSQKTSTLPNNPIQQVFPPPGLPAIDLEEVLQRLNLVKEVQRRIGKTSDGARQHSVNRYAPRFLTYISSFLLACLGSVLDLLNAKVVGRNSFKDISATGHQLDVRLRQAYTAPAQLRLSHDSVGRQSTSSRAQYISFYNMLWLIANDIIIGSAVLAFFTDNDAFIVRYVTWALKDLSVRRLQEILLWLNNWPGGLKLNFELGKFFCDAFLWFTAAWDGIVLDRILLPNLQAIIYLIGLSAATGTTMSLALCSDLLSLSTLHLYLFYSMATAVFSFHTSAMGSLFNIFRGKKRNVLRNRVEPSSYTLDQLLVGAILFTLAAFLLPTVLAFYLVFAAARCAIIAIHASLEAVLAFLNHFPLFAMMLRVKDPKRLPGGLAFRLEDSRNAVYLIMENNPIPLSAIFHQYWALWSSFSQHYSPLYLLKKVFNGRYISPIPRSRLTFTSRAEAVAE